MMLPRSEIQAPNPHGERTLWCSISYTTWTTDCFFFFLPQRQLIVTIQPGVAPSILAIEPQPEALDDSVRFPMVPHV